ncbi:hypothetical protein [Nocardia callitridis]|uniref:Uncharacterized protein n=1 Tax=Nocardia callitridis TaxID=648753 RepID=A0ABP9KHH1_9NOCA
MLSFLIALVVIVGLAVLIARITANSTTWDLIARAGSWDLLDRDTERVRAEIAAIDSHGRDHR